MQKLFSAFPNGRPGFGLLLLRALVSAILITQTMSYITGAKVSLLSLCAAGFATLIAGCLLVGFLTPVVAIVIGLGAFCLAYLDPTNTWVDVIVLAAVILLLGPGAFSVDARMFGRREIRIPAVPGSIAK